MDYFAGRDTPQTTRLDTALDSDEELCICGLVLTEILQGIRSSAEQRRVRRKLDDLSWLPMEREAFVLAADIYRKARAAGKTIRNTVDCIVAAAAITGNALLLHRDRDFHTIANVSPLRILSCE